MDYSFDEQRKLEKAKRRVKDIKGFYKHLAAYLVINIFLLVLHAVNMKEGENFFRWTTFITAGSWGLGLMAHYFSVFGANIFFSKGWEERKIKELMEKEKNRKQGWE